MELLQCSRFTWVPGVHPFLGTFDQYPNRGIWRLDRILRLGGYQLAVQHAFNRNRSDDFQFMCLWQFRAIFLDYFVQCSYIANVYIFFKIITYNCLVLGQRAGGPIDVHWDYVDQIDYFRPLIDEYIYIYIYIFQVYTSFQPLIPWHIPTNPQHFPNKFQKKQIQWMMSIERFYGSSLIFGLFS